MADTSLNENRIGLLVWQTCNIWQSKLRKILKNSNISLNEYFIIETIYKLNPAMEFISQTTISNNSFLDISVVSINLKLLETKNLIKRSYVDNRTKNISLTKEGNLLISSLIKTISSEEHKFFYKLEKQTFNFTNSLKLLLGKKIRIRANY